MAIHKRVRQAGRKLVAHVRERRRALQRTPMIASARRSSNADRINQRLRKSQPQSEPGTSTKFPRGAGADLRLEVVPAALLGASMSKAQRGHRKRSRKSLPESAHRTHCN